MRPVALVTSPGFHYLLFLITCTITKVETGSAWSLEVASNVIRVQVCDLQWWNVYTIGVLHAQI